jgi:2,4-diaminopentanoate dehydrogenase
VAAQVVTRVVVCYTGGVGSQVIRLLAGDPAFQVAGVLVHHEEKAGRDAGELAGIDPIGVAATRDIDALVALRADCMLWHGLTWEPQVVARFLAAGTNVYSSMGGWYLPGEPEHELLAAACAEGGSTFAAGGNIPGLISDVLPLFISGYSGRVRFIRAWQSSYVPNYPSTLQLQFGLGIGVEPDPTATGPSEDMELIPSGLKVAKGTPAGVRWTYTAYTGDVPFFELVNEQTVRLGLGEGWRASVDEPNWRLEVTGEPNIRATVALPDEGEGVAPVSALNAARAVNFVPRLVAAPAGCLSVLDVAAPTGTTHSFGTSQ